MAMPFAYTTPGAEVEKVLDVESKVLDTQGQFAGYKWKPSNPRKRGFIVSVKIPGDEPVATDCVEYVMVKFEAGKDPERCLPTQLNLIKVANEAAMAALKNEANIQKANDGLLDDMKKPVVTDQTGVPRTKGKGLSKAEAEDLAKK